MISKVPDTHLYLFLEYCRKVILKCEDYFSSTKIICQKPVVIYRILKEIFKKKNVVGFDIVELCPNEKDKSSDFLAAKLYYKMLSYKFKYEDGYKEDED